MPTITAVKQIAIADPIVNLWDSASLIFDEAYTLARKWLLGSDKLEVAQIRSDTHPDRLGACFNSGEYLEWLGTLQAIKDLTICGLRGFGMTTTTVTAMLTEASFLQDLAHGFAPAGLQKLTTSTLVDKLHCLAAADFGIKFHPSEPVSRFARVMFNCVVDAAIATFTHLRAEAMPIPSDGPLREHVEKVVSIVELCHLVLANKVIFSEVSYTFHCLQQQANNHSFPRLHGHADALETNYCFPTIIRFLSFTVMRML